MIVCCLWWTGKEMFCQKAGDLHYVSRWRIVDVVKLTRWILYHTENEKIHSSSLS